MPEPSSRSYPKPVPVADTWSEGFWAAAATHTLALQQCCACGRYAHPPVVVCPRCQSAEAEFRFHPLSGRGRLRTWTVMRDAFLPGFRDDVPWLVGEAELDDAPGVRLLARIANDAATKLAIGMPVVTEFVDVAPGVALPVLKVVSA